jgi:hypothetical protein
VHRAQALVMLTAAAAAKLLGLSARKVYALAAAGTPVALCGRCGGSGSVESVGADGREAIVQVLRNIPASAARLQAQGTVQ